MLYPRIRLDYWETTHIGICIYVFIYILTPQFFISITSILCQNYLAKFKSVASWEEILRYNPA